MMWCAIVLSLMGLKICADFIPVRTPSCLMFEVLQLYSMCSSGHLMVWEETNRIPTQRWHLSGFRVCNFVYCWPRFCVHVAVTQKRGPSGHVRRHAYSLGLLVPTRTKVNAAALRTHRQGSSSHLNPTYFLRVVGWPRGQRAGEETQTQRCCVCLTATSVSLSAPKTP